MKRTGSMGSRVPPAVTSTFTPDRSCGSASARSSSSWASVVISSGSGSRPAPVSAPVSRPDAGSSTMAPRRRKVATFSTVAGMEPHLGVHRRREHHRTAGGQQRGGQQVVGAACDGPRQQVGGRGGDDHEVGLLADADVRHLVDSRRTRRCAPVGRTAPRKWRRRRTSEPTRWERRGRSGRLRRADGPRCTPCRRRCRRRRRRRSACARSCLLFAPEAHRGHRRRT